LLGGQSLGLDEQGAELKAFTGAVEDGRGDADLALSSTQIYLSISNN
jgi:hypothetical protein